MKTLLATVAWNEPASGERTLSDYPVAQRLLADYVLRSPPISAFLPAIFSVLFDRRDCDKRCFKINGRQRTREDGAIRRKFGVHNMLHYL